MWKNQKKNTVFFSWKKPTLSLWKKLDLRMLWRLFILFRQILSQGRVMITLHFVQPILKQELFYTKTVYVGLILATIFQNDHPLIYFKTGLKELFSLSPHNVGKRSSFVEISSFFTFRLFILYWFTGKSTLALFEETFSLPPLSMWKNHCHSLNKFFFHFALIHHLLV